MPVEDQNTTLDIFLPLHFLLSFFRLSFFFFYRIERDVVLVFDHVLPGKQTGDRLQLTMCKKDIFTRRYTWPLNARTRSSLTVHKQTNEPMKRNNVMEFLVFSLLKNDRYCLFLCTHFLDLANCYVTFVSYMTTGRYAKRKFPRLATSDQNTADFPFIRTGPDVERCVKERKKTANLYAIC